MKAKKIIAVALSALLTVSTLFGCGNSNSTSNENSEKTESSAQTESTENGSASGDHAQDIAIITSTSGLGDMSFNDAAKRGLEKAKKELSINYQIVEPAEISQGESYLRQFAQEGYGVVATLEYAHADAIATVADEFPDTCFVMFNLVIDKPNVISVMFDVQEPSYLAGVLAGELTKPGVVVIDGKTMKDDSVIGFIGGADSPGIRVFSEAFYQGAYSVNPDVKMIADYSVGFGDTQNAKSVTNNMIQSQNADVVFHAAGLSGLGVFQAVKENNVLAVGVDDNQDSIEPGYIITSVLKNMDVAIMKIAKDMKENNLQIGVQKMSLLEDGVGLTDMSVFSNVITDKETWATIEESLEKAKQGILDGSITVIDGAAGETFQP